MNYYYHYHYHIIFFTYIKWHKDLSAKYYQDNKERLQKIVKDIKVLLKKIKKKKIETIWTWVIQKPLRRWKAMAC